MVFVKYIAAMFLSVCILCACSGKEAKPNVDIDISETVKANDVDLLTSTLLIKRLSDHQKWFSNKARNDIGFPPASTSKIPHTLIALETGLARPDTVFKWDGKKRFVRAWNQDQTLTTAFQRSAVWAYQQITSEIGGDVMKEWLQTFAYGNANIGPPESLKRYWLDGPLEISAHEQVDFLTKLAHGQLPLSEKTYQNTRKIMVADSGDGWTLYAKTGWRSDGVNTDIGWYVGWVESSLGGHDEIYVFAFNMDLLTKEDRGKRVKTIYKALEFINAIPVNRP